MAMHTEPRLTDMGYIRSLLERHGFRFSKKLGQNFLINPSVCPRMAEACGCTPETGVLEIGPGFGVLTRELSLRAGKVVAIELDDRLLPVLAETLAGRDNVEIVSGDCMKLNLVELLRDRFGDRPVAVCANLPYYITTPAVSALIDSGCFDTITVMVQKEVAQRMCAAAGSSDYGAFTPYIAYHCHPQLVLEVGRECFIPSPKVDSAVVRMDMYDKPPVEVKDEKMFFRVIKAAFAQRRKTLLNCLSMSFPEKGKDGVRAAIEACGISPSCRGEPLDISQFARLADEFSK